MKHEEHAFLSKFGPAIAGIIIGTGAKLAKMYKDGANMSWFEGVTTGVICVFCGYLASQACIIYDFENLMGIATALATYFSEKVLVIIGQSIRPIILQLVGKSGKKK